MDITELQRQLSAQGQTGFLSLINLFSGGALGRMAVFGLGIMPYITSSIIMQLLTVVIPKLQQWQDQGEAGTKKINQWTRYLTVVLALLQSTGLVFLFHNKSQSGIDVFPGTLFTPAEHRPGDPDVHRRNRDDHVARRADHPARHGQRHVHPDLHERDLAPAL